MRAFDEQVQRSSDTFNTFYVVFLSVVFRLWLVVFKPAMVGRLRSEKTAQSDLSREDPSMSSQ